MVPIGETGGLCEAVSAETVRFGLSFLEVGDLKDWWENGSGKDRKREDISGFVDESG